MRIRDLLPFGKKKSIVNTMDHGPVDTSWDLGFWQQDKKILRSDINSTVEACVSALSQTAAMCPLHHIKDEDENGDVRQKGSNLERVMLNPNEYQTRSTFLVDAIRSMYFEGNAYAVAQRNQQGTIRALYLMNPRTTQGVIDPETGQVFYYVSPNGNVPSMVSEEDRIFPARDVMHLRLYSSAHDPLRGETPLQAAAASIAANNAISGHQQVFFNQMSRPSGVLATDSTLNREQMKQLRQAWEEQSQGINSGKIPILSSGMKFSSMSLSSQDAQLVEAYSMTVADISRAFRVPLVLINDMSGATFNNSEQTAQFFLMSGLGFLLDHVELHIARLWGLPFDQNVNFDTSVLMRTNFEERIKGLSEGVINGIFSPNEARAQEGLPAVEGGEEPRVQQQVQPLSAFDRQMQLEEEIASQPEPEPEPEEDEEKALVLVRNAYEKALTNYAAS